MNLTSLQSALDQQFKTMTSTHDNIAEVTYDIAELGVSLIVNMSRKTDDEQALNYETLKARGAAMCGGFNRKQDIAIVTITPENQQVYQAVDAYFNQKFPGGFGAPPRRQFESVTINGRSI